MGAIADQGLKRRAVPGVTDKDESPYLDELKEIAETGVTPAERLLDRYRTVWGGNIDRLYEEESY
jgi:glutamate--cysteine ligase